MERIKKFFRNIDLRKFFGTIVGGIFFLCCVAYFTYAYYEWKSDETFKILSSNLYFLYCNLSTKEINLPMTFLIVLFFVLSYTFINSKRK